MPTPIKPENPKQRAYWRRNLAVTGSLLAVWVMVTFLVPFYAQELNEFTLLGFPLAFYMGAQGSVLVYVLVIWFYAYCMNRLDKKYGLDDD